MKNYLCNFRTQDRGDIHFQDDDRTFTNSLSFKNVFKYFSFSHFLIVSTRKTAVGTVETLNAKKLSEDTFQNCLYIFSTPKYKEDMNFQKLEPKTLTKQYDL